MPHWIAVTLAVCAIICTVVYVIDFVWATVDALRKAGRESMRQQFLNAILRIAPMLLQGYLASAQPSLDRAVPGVVPDAPSDLPFMMVHFHRGTADGIACDISFSNGAQHEFVTGYSPSHWLSAFNEGVDALVAKVAPVTMEAPPPPPVAKS